MALIEPYYPKAGGGRKPHPLKTMLRVYLAAGILQVINGYLQETGLVAAPRHHR